ncbi:hypothetical protein KSF78_0006901 [Schistosoma japonicum]|nr:hypothetical protein KSF78_0006901 [Schistosoma japonicum]
MLLNRINTILESRNLELLNLFGYCDETVIVFHFYLTVIKFLLRVVTKLFRKCFTIIATSRLENVGHAVVTISKVLFVPLLPT